MADLGTNSEAPLVVEVVQAVTEEALAKFEACMERKSVEIVVSEYLPGSQRRGPYPLEVLREHDGCTDSQLRSRVTREAPRRADEAIPRLRVG